MIKNIFANKVFFVSIFFLFLIIISLTFVFSALKLINTDIYPYDLKVATNSIENIIKSEMVNKPSRFTSLFYIKNKPILNNIDEYRSAYRNFSTSFSSLYKGINVKVKYIEKNIAENNNAPAFIDNVSGYLFYPVSYLEINKVEELKNNRNKLFFTKKNSEVNEELINDGKILNYIFINFNDKSFIVLISPPYDPDPLYPNNKREIVIISIKKKGGNNYTTYFKNFSISNKG